MFIEFGSAFKFAVTRLAFEAIMNDLVRPEFSSCVVQVPANFTFKQRVITRRTSLTLLALGRRQAVLGIQAEVKSARVKTLVPRDW
jgi:hypothetical protein